jgi:anti-sigma regulatory factor (Ser/Thr protein kinase)
MRDVVSLEVQDLSAVGEARRLTRALARAEGFSEVGEGHAAIVATEMATNLIKHAGGGELFLRTVQCCGVGGLELLAVDSGAGMADIAWCQRDGVSSTKTAGTGLGAIWRLSHVADVVSWPDRGTAIMARLWAKSCPACPDQRPYTVGAVCRALHAEEPCGDAWAVEQDGDRAVVLVVDGLGHGLDAAIAAQRALEVFAVHWALSPQELMERLHAALRGTRGAAALAVTLDRVRGEARVCGVGNVMGRVVRGDADLSMVSWPGIVGYQASRVREEILPLGPEDWVILATDGLRTEWDWRRYPGIMGHHPSLMAGVLFRDFFRQRDDATVVVLRPVLGSGWVL